jgi:hypothetical protein
MQTESITVHANHSDILLPSVHLRDFLTINDVSENVIQSCESALDDLLKTIVDDACQGDDHKMITVNISYNGSGVYIETQDEGYPIEFSASKVFTAKNLIPLTSEDLLEESENKNILDEVWYEVDMGKNIWQLVKYL